MDRWGCVDVLALPLQLLLQRHPDWAGQPVAVVADDAPQAEVLWSNRAAWQRRVRPGLRYAEALSLAADLRAGVVTDAEVRAATARIASLLRRATPEVEPSADAPGVFWLNASGLERLHPSLRDWALGIVAGLRREHLRACVAVGFDRFCTYALARANGCRGRQARARGWEVCVRHSREEERRSADRVPLELLQLAPKLRRGLDRLGIRDVGALRRLPGGGMLERFGREAHVLQRLAAGTAPDPLVPESEVLPARERLELDPGGAGIDVHQLLFLIKQRLGHLLGMLADRGEAVAVLSVRVLLEDAPGPQEHLRPAAPTLDELQLLDLLRLRLESLELNATPVGFELQAEGVPAPQAQLELFAERARRDLRAANRALARLRAELGEDAVVRAELCDGHLPEARFRWQPIESLSAPRPGEARDGPRRLVRRVLARPLALGGAGPDGCFAGAGAGGIAAGPVQHRSGPYPVSGGWWRREVDREYWFGETRDGLLWLYFDRRRRRWFLQGTVG